MSRLARDLLFGLAVALAANACGHAGVWALGALR
jgi:hypothetical protein